jgi:uncharacterized protein (DUF433 family)
LRLEGLADMPVVTANHIQVDEKGVARIDGSRMKVKHIAVEKSQGMSEEEIQKAHPFLSMAQIYAALSYYYDHKAEIDARIQRDEREYQRLRAEAGEAPFVKRMRAAGKLP